jgi:hypothetical protein
MVRWLVALLLALAAPVAAAAPDAVPPPPAGVVAGRFVLPDRPLWAGEVFTLRFVWQVDWDLFRYLDGDLAWTADPLVTEGWTREPLGTPRPLGTRSVADIGFTTRAASLSAGSIALQAATQQMQIVTGSYETSGVTIATIGPVLARRDAATVKIRALPPAPPTFSGAVGDFTLKSAVDTATVMIGKPIVWTVTLAGTGNWMGFGGVPSRPLPGAFEMVGKPEQAAATTVSLFERTVSEAITIVPRRAGTFSLGPIRMTVFDPAAGRFRTIAAPPIALVVKPGAAASVAPRSRSEVAATPSEAGLPPPLQGVGHARPPLPRWAWRSVLALPLVVLSLAWLGLAAHRALVRDPERGARRAHARLTRTVAALAMGPDAAARRALVRDWQRDAATRLKIDHAAPTPGIVRDSAWAQLWDEADRHLYGADVPLPPDWPVRADTALAETGAPARFDVARIFTVANLYPALALLCLAFAISPAPLSATDPPRQAAIAPLDWIGHYNRGRQAAAASNWPEAAVHAGIAWVQAPRSAETTALWTLAAREAGFGGRSAGSLPVPNATRGRLTGLLPPLGWQAITIASVLLVIGGCGMLLLVRFGHARRIAMLLAATVAGIGTLGGFAGWLGVAGYGPAAAPDAAITWRPVPLRALPVDTPDADAMLLLPPGTVGHRDAGFMGWSHITLGDGRAGWVRRRELKPLWEAQR